MNQEYSNTENTALNPETWVDHYGDYLYCFAISRVRDPSVAEDLVQETFLAALNSIKSFASRSSPKTWLTGILKHKIESAIVLPPGARERIKRSIRNALNLK